MAYKLELLVESKIHLIFHVSLLKRHHGHHLVHSTLPLIAKGDYAPLLLVVIVDKKENEENEQSRYQESASLVG